MWSRLKKRALVRDWGVCGQDGCTPSEVDRRGQWRRYAVLKDLKAPNICWWEIVQCYTGKMLKYECWRFQLTIKKCVYCKDTHIYWNGMCTKMSFIFEVDLGNLLTAQDIFCCFLLKVVVHAYFSILRVRFGGLVNGKSVFAVYKNFRAYYAKQMTNNVCVCFLGGGWGGGGGGCFWKIHFWWKKFKTCYKCV